jgi:saccharopine dehydrogenase-like NADP-dependent oxidoreductase
VKLPRRKTHERASGSAGQELKVAVLGAGGTIAPAIVRDLAESEEISGMLLLDIDEGRAAAVAERHGKGKARAARADARASAGEPGSVARAISRCDVLVNSASYRVNLDAMRACLSTGTHYLDLGGLYWMTGRQLELGPEFERAGLLALLGTGSAPGKTNLMAARAARELGGDPTTLDVSAGGRDLHPPSGFSVPYSLQTIVDELTMRPVVIRDGSPVEIEPLAEAGKVDFGSPIGAAETIYTLHSELRTFPTSFRCRKASFKLSLEPNLLSRLRELALGSRERIARAAAHAVPPSPKTIAIHMVEASGAGKQVRVRCLNEPLSRWKLGGGVVSTAGPAAAAVRLLARGTVESRGVLPRVEALRADEMFAELERRGASFDVDVREEVAA